jgi:hypothetical protein
LGIILPSIKVFKNTKILQLLANLGKCQFYCKKGDVFSNGAFFRPQTSVQSQIVGISHYCHLGEFVVL